MIHNGIFTVPYAYEFHSTSLDEVAVILGDMSKYLLYAWGSQTMNKFGIKSNESSSKNYFDQDKVEDGN